MSDATFTHPPDDPIPVGEWANDWSLTLTRPKAPPHPPVPDDGD